MKRLFCYFKLPIIQQYQLYYLFPQKMPQLPMSHNIEWNLTGPTFGNRGSLSTADVIRHACMTSKDTEAW
jgi:hypothetical protein